MCAITAIVKTHVPQRVVVQARPAVRMVFVLLRMRARMTEIARQACAQKGHVRMRAPAPIQRNVWAHESVTSAPAKTPVQQPVVRWAKPADQMGCVLDRVHVRVITTASLGYAEMTALVRMQINARALPNV